MSKSVVLEGWSSQIPNKMYDRWVTLKWIVKGAKNLSATCSTSGWSYRLHKKSNQSYIFVHSTLAMKKAKKDGWILDHRYYRVKEINYDKMKKDVDDWYKYVFETVRKWLTKEGLLNLKQGDPLTGFCVESNAKSEVVKKWNAPLANKGNKVAQIKEKFGYITVYFDNLTPEEKIKINKYAKQLEKKHDCKTRFN